MSDTSDLEIDSEIPSNDVTGKSSSRGPKVKGGGRKKMFRWTLNRDTVLVNEVDSLKPFLEHGKKANEIWTSVAAVINSTYSADVDYLAVKRRFNLLLADFKKEDFKNRYKSGTEEEITSIVEKLGNILSLVDDAKLEEESEIVAKNKKVESEKAIADEIRSAAVLTIKRPAKGDDATPPSKRTSEKSLSDMWHEKQANDQLQYEKKLELEEKRHADDVDQRAKDRELRMKELELKEKEIELQRVKEDHMFQLRQEEAKLQRERLEVEKEERASMVQTQKTMLDLLMKHLN